MRLTLSNENISLACEEAGTFLLKKEIDPKDVLRVKLSLEGVLLTYQKKFGSDAEFLLEMASHLRRVIIRVTLKGLSYDPLAGSAELSEEEIMMHSIMSQMKPTPRWEYTLGNNVINYVIRKKQSSYWLSLVTAIAAGVLLGLLLRLAPENVRTLISQDIITPLLSKFMGFLSAIAGPLIFLSVVWSIYSIGDLRTFIAIGKKCAGFFCFPCV